MDPGEENGFPFWSFPLIVTELLSAEMLTGTTADSLPPKVPSPPYCATTWYSPPGRVLMGPLKAPLLKVPPPTAVLLKVAGAFFAISTNAPLGVPEPESDFTLTLKEIGC